jgi:uncharacterized protein YndB with AHSA1/START domain
MTVVSVDKDLDALTLTIVAEFDAPIERVWQLWADPRQLERWWGPPGHPATFHEHDLTPGGGVAYSMAVPDGDASHGWWRVEAVDPPRSLEVVDGWADPDGMPRAGAPTTTIRMRLAERDGRTRMEIRSTFSSREHLEQVIRIGAVEAFEQSVGQIDALLAA